MTREEINLHNREWFKKTYDSLIESRKYRGTTKKPGDGFNRHHIIPKCLGGTNDLDNIVLLTFREHIIAHQLLHRIYPDNNSLTYAFLRMIQSSHSDRKDNRYKTDKNGNKIPFTTRELEELKKKSSKHLSKVNTGKRHTEETKKKISLNKKGKTYGIDVRLKLSEIRMGHEVSQETKDKISKARVGIEFTEEHKNKLSNYRKGISLSEEAKEKISGKNNKSSKTIIDPTGMEFVSKKECSKFHNICIEKLNKLLNDESSGFRYKDPMMQGSNRFSYKIKDPEGRIFNSLVQCSKFYNRDKKTIKNWIENHPEKGFSYIS